MTMPNDALGAAPGTDTAQAAAAAALAAGEGAPTGPQGQDTPPAVTPPEVVQMTDQQIAEIADPALRTQATNLKAGWDKAMRELADQRKDLEGDDVVKYVRELRELAENDPAEAARRLRLEADYFDRGTGPPATGTRGEPAPTGDTAAIDKQLQSLGLPPTADMTDTERVLVQMLTGLATTVRGMQGSLANENLDTQLAGLRRTHGAAFDKAAERTVLETAHRTGLTDLGEAYRIAFFDKEREAGRAAAYEELRKKGVAVEPPDVGRPTTATPPSSVEEIVQQEADKLGIA